MIISDILISDEASLRHSSIRQVTKDPDTLVKDEVMIIPDILVSDEAMILPDILVPRLGYNYFRNSNLR